MGFLRRFFGSDPAPDPAESTDATDEPAGANDEAEQARELVLLREEQARSDELIRRQQRYAAYAWQPPAQGGERRADDEGTDRS